MIIKSHEGNRAHYSILVLCILSMFFIIISLTIKASKMNIPIEWLYFTIAYIGSTSLFMLLDCIKTFRTFTFSCEGIEVSILFYKKFYSWDELSFRRYESYGKYFFSSNGKTAPPYVRCVKFYTKEIKNSRNKNPELLLGLSHPLSFVFVNFLEEGVKVEDLYRRRPPIYTYDEKEFMDNMKKWGVKIVEDL